jgi:hypothetical protein
MNGEGGVFLMVVQDHQPFARSEYAVSNDNVLELKRLGRVNNQANQMYVQTRLTIDAKLRASFS